MQPIQRETIDGICVLTFDRPGSSANIFDRATLELLEELISDLSGARGLVLISAKDSIFIAGADLNAIARMKADEVNDFIALGQRVFGKIAALPIPTVAAIHGVAVGGGCEVALACDWRVASPDRCTKIGLPETQLGIVPAWGGSTRLPKLIGVPRALDIILGGKTLTAKHAKKVGLVDDIAPRERLRDAARRWIAEGKHPRSLMHSAAVNAVVDAVISRKTRADVLKKTRSHYPAIENALDVVLAGSAKSDESIGLSLERDAIQSLIGLPSTRNLIRLFFLQERAKKLSVPEAAAPVARVEHAAVIGAGIMGSGIAQWLSSRGVHVLLRDVDAERVAAGMGNIAKVYADGVRHRVLTEHEAKRGIDRVSPAPAEVPLNRVDLVIEAAVEKMDVKKLIFRRLDELVSADALLATNTSALSITELAAATKHPHRVVGIHFFNPVHRMQLVEVVIGKETSPDSAQRAVRFVQQIGKLPVLVKDSPGFLVNRILLPYMIEAGRLFEEGLSVESIDAAMLDFGMPMGPLRLIDEVGVDISADVAQTLSAAFPDRLRVPEVLGKMIGSGLLGRKSGAGFYTHGKRGEESPNPKVDSLRSATATSRETPTDRLVLAMVNEAARCLEEKVVEKPADVDFAMVMGTGWAPFRGGTLRYADSLGAAAVTEKLSALAATAGPQFVPCALLADMAKQGKRFYED